MCSPAVCDAGNAPLLMTRRAGSWGIDTTDAIFRDARNPRLGHGSPMTLDQLADDLKTRRTTSAELVETAISKAKSAPNVFFTLLEDQSRAAAAESDKR